MWYKENTISLGSSDVAALTVTGLEPSTYVITSGIIKLQTDGSYNAYLVKDFSKDQIPSHYEKILSFSTWIHIYDDDGLVYKSKNSKANYDIYRAGLQGILINEYNT